MKAITFKVLLKDLHELINAARQDVALQVNSSLVLLYWRVGKRIHQDIRQEKRAEYGEQIFSALRRELSWTHLKQIIYLDDPLKRDFYAEMCRIERWSTRTLEKKIAGMLFGKKDKRVRPQHSPEHDPLCSGA